MKRKNHQASEEEEEEEVETPIKKKTKSKKDESFFRAKIAKASVLKKIFTSILGLVDQANLECDENGITLQCMDSSHVSFVALKLDLPFFIEYKCPQFIMFGIDFKNINTIFDCSKNEDTVILESDEDACTLRISFIDEKKNSESEYVLKLMDIQTDPLHVPEPENTNVVTMKSENFKKIIADFSKFGTEVTFDATTDQIVLSVAGKIGEGRIVLKPSEEASTTIKLVEPIKMMFALRYLSNFAKAETVAPVVSIILTNGCPLCVMFEHPGALRLKFFLAPKLEEDAAFN